MEASNTAMSNVNGDLAFYSNSCFISNKLHQQMDNGDDLNPGLMQQNWCQTGGNPLSQAIISLPVPNTPDQYYVFHEGLNAWSTSSGSDFAPFNLYYSIINMTENGGLGEVTTKNNIALADTLFRGFISAVKHGNGRDWWIVVPKHDSNCYFKLLLSPNGIDSISQQCIGEPWGQFEDSSGQAVFSPNGTKYAIYQTCHGLDLFDFNRCTGEFSNAEYISMLPDSCEAGGAAFSPNSQFLYLTTTVNLYQFDLLSNDLLSSKTLIGTREEIPIPNQIQSFFQCQLAPDGKIYIGPDNSDGVVYSLHVINSPDSLGSSCDLVKRGVQLPGPIFSSLPSFPHFNLGILENEPCDTTVSIFSPSLQEEKITIYPNPFQETTTVEIKGNQKKLNIQIFDLLGRLKKSSILTNQLNHIDLSELKDGIYIFRIQLNDSYFTKKVIK
ncbi:MAG: T9SS type A sorting domain-containing protein, partial [Cyanobacteria bacterium J06649_11]